MIAERARLPHQARPSDVARLHNVVRIYRASAGEVHALRGVDVAFPLGSITAIAGPSGGGKSTLLSILALRDQASAGQVTLGDTDVTTLTARARHALRRNTIAWVPQRPAHALLPHLSAIDNLEQVRRVRPAAVAGRGLSSEQALDVVRLTHRSHARPARLSGGEQQRLAVATALVAPPDLVVADEPTAELDDDNASVVLDALMGLGQQGVTCVLSTHDPRALRHLPRVLHLRHGVLSAERTGADWSGLDDEPGEGRRSRRAPGIGDAVIDSAGRLQLTPEALALFPLARARVEIVDGAVVLRPPQRDEEAAP